MKVSYEHFAGIDTSKAHLDVRILPGDVLKRFSNNAAGHRELIKLFKSHKVDLIVIEATGGYEHPVVVAMVLAGLRVHVAQPQVIRAFAKSHALRAKNDTLDANVCCRFAQERWETLRIIEKIDLTQEKLKALVNRRQELVEMHSGELNRLQQTADKSTASSIARMIRLFQKEIHLIEEEIDATIAADQALAVKRQKLQENYGIGPQVARILLALLPELGTVDRKRLNALVGVAPYDAQSGNKDGPRRIAGGRALVRNGLYMACMTAAFHDPVMEEYYKKKIAEGKAHKTAMMACIRKMLAYLDKQIRSLALPPTLSTPQTAMPSTPQTGA